MRAVITGGAGFLGSHLCELMLEKGWDVLCLDNLVTGSDSNISHLLPHPKFRFARQDVSRYIEVPGPVEAVRRQPDDPAHVRHSLAALSL